VKAEVVEQTLLRFLELCGVIWNLASLPEAAGESPKGYDAS
jgi:hypothetical protein